MFPVRVRRKELTSDRRSFLLDEIVIGIKVEVLENIDVKDKTILTDLNVSLELLITIVVFWTLICLEIVVRV